MKASDKKEMIFDRSLKGQWWELLTIMAKVPG